MSRGQNELVGNFKMAAGDMVCIRSGADYGVHVNRNQKGVGEIWCGLRMEGMSSGLLAIHSNPFKPILR